MSEISKWINTIEGLRLIESPRVRRIEFFGVISISQIKQLLHFLEENSQEFALYDPLYPSPSDPGAYFSYSPKKSNQQMWSMTLGNHGWSGGIYQIEERTIYCQLKSLISRNLLKSLQIDNVGFFSNYQLKDFSTNKEMNNKLVKIHGEQVST